MYVRYASNKKFLDGMQPNVSAKTSTSSDAKHLNCVQTGIYCCRGQQAEEEEKRDAQ